MMFRDLVLLRSCHHLVVQVEKAVDTATTVSARPVSLGKAVLLASAWGVGRRVVAVRRAGHILSGFALSMAGLRAAAGMTALVTTHGPDGAIRPCRTVMPWDDVVSLALPQVLDAPSGSRGTTAMTRKRWAVDLGE